VSITCTICNTANKDEAIYCKECGNKLSIEKKSASSEQQNNLDKKTASLIGIVIIVVIVIFALKEANNTDGNSTIQEPTTLEEFTPVAEEITPMSGESAPITKETIPSAKLTSLKNTSNVRMPDAVLDAIRHVECLKDKDEKCDPNVIRINETEDAKRAEQAGFYIQNHIIRCNSTEECSAQTTALINGGITNLNLGPYQINYKYHPNPMLHEYFLDVTEREHVNNILVRLVKQHGYSWETLGRYHHFSATDRTENERYYRKLYAYIYGVKE